MMSRATCEEVETVMKEYGCGWDYAEYFIDLRNLGYSVEDALILSGIRSV